MKHDKPSPLAGSIVKIKDNVKHPQVSDFGGSEYKVEDWWDRVNGTSWMFCNGNSACLVYALRTGLSGNEETIINDEVLYGKIGSYGHLVHISEIEIVEKVIK